MPHMSDNYSGPPQFDDGSPRPAPGYSGASPNPPPSIGGALSWAWSAIKDNPIVLLVGFAVWMILCGIGVNGHYELNGVQHSYGFAWGAPITIVASLFSMIALAHVCLAVASGRRVTFTDFVTFPNCGQALLTSFLTYLAVVIGSLLCIIPGVAAAFLLFFARFIVVDRGTSAGDAIPDPVGQRSRPLSIRACGVRPHASGNRHRHRMDPHLPVDGSHVRLRLRAHPGA